MKVLNPVIDGCIFMDADFEGISKGIMKSKVDTFFLTMNSFAGYGETVKSITKIYKFVEDEPNIRVARTYNEIIENSDQGKKSLILTFQEPYPIGNSLNNLRTFYEMGVRVVQLTYNKSNYIGSGCTETNGGGLTDFGSEVVLEMNKLGMLVDLSHCNELTAREAIKTSEKPVVFSHGNASSVTENPRNKSDELIELVAKTGGVIGLTPWAPLCWNKNEIKQPALDDYLNHVEYVINLVGIDHVGFGSDVKILDTPSIEGAQTQATFYPEVVGGYYGKVGMDREISHAKDFKGAKEIDNVIESLLKRGYSETDVNKFLGGNFLRVLENVIGK
ncbi:dipeptidase [Virgibacillus oceani]